jgi:DNA invertase Pin-like site-specific DNA recombinase
MGERVDAEGHRAAFERLRAVREELLGHARAVRELAAVRRALIQELIDVGFTQSDVARELGVTRQAVQKMLSVG